MRGKFANRGGARSQPYHYHTRTWPISVSGNQEAYSVTNIPPLPARPLCSSPLSAFPTLYRTEQSAVSLTVGILRARRPSKQYPPAKLANAQVPVGPRNSHQHQPTGEASILRRTLPAKRTLADREINRHDTTTRLFITYSCVPHPAGPREPQGNIRFDRKRMSRPPMI